MEKFTLFLSNINNAVLTKDVGLIPFIMGKYCNCSSSIISLNKEEDLYINNKYLDNLDIIVSNDNLVINDTLIKTDILMLVGLYDFNYQIIRLYKSLNPKGKIYLKLDGSSYWITNLNKVISEEHISILKQCNLISVESRRLQVLINSIWNLNVKYIPNGYYNFNNEEDKIIKYEDKENIILFAGRVGAQGKCNELLLESFKNIAHIIPNWKVKLVGDIDSVFINYINQYFVINPNLRDRIIFVEKKEKKELKKIYEKSKIFCLTSISEACANVMSESISNGCYLISTDVDGAIDIIDYGKYGKIIPILDLQKLQESLLEICLNEEVLKNNCEKSQQYCIDNLQWKTICEDIKSLI